MSQAADDVAHPAAENLRQLLLHPALTRFGLFPEQRVGRAPEVADDVQDVQHACHALPRLEERGRQAPQAEGAIEQDDQGLAVQRVPARGIGLDEFHHRLLRAHQAGHTPHLLGSRRLVRHVLPLPACTRRFWMHHEFCQRCGRPWLGFDRVAHPDQRFLLLLPLLTRAQLALSLTLRFDIGTPLPQSSHP